MESQPMDFFVRVFPEALLDARQRLADFLRAQAEDLVFVENATQAMNVVANSFPLASQDQVLLTNHEYGAVQRIWQLTCERVGAEVATVDLPDCFETTQEVVDTILAACTDRTRLLVISHITSPTAVTLPVQEICEGARQRGIQVCIDGPHAPAQVPVNLETLGCDYYCASCHKWLSAPFGTGFLYVAREHQFRQRPLTLSWGQLPPEEVSHWSDEFLWSGTRDPSAYLAVPAAIDFMENVGLRDFQEAGHALAQYARQQLIELTGVEPMVADDPCWYGCMAQHPLPPGDARELQTSLWKQYGIEVPIVDWNQRRFVRVSCHLYNDQSQVDRLMVALRELLA
jgi:isopenicillin-N epimerase